MFLQESLKSPFLSQKSTLYFMNLSSMSDSLQDALRIAKNYAKEYHNDAIDGSHLLKALMHKELGLRDMVTALKQDYNYLSEWAEVRMEDLPKTTHHSENIIANEGVTRVVEEGDNVRIKLGLDAITPTCLLVALCKPNIAFTAQQLKSFPVKERDILDLYLKDQDLHATLGDTAGGTVENAGGSPSAGGALYRYCTDKTSMAREGALDPVFGRDREVRMMTEVLARRTKPNVLLIGEPGVGKTALVDGFAQNIAAGKVPSQFKNHLLLELNIGTLLSGAAYKGEVEDRLKSIVTEIKKAGNIILFIDELHMLLDSKNPLISGAGNTLKPELARGAITVIGATTVEEYRKIIEPEKAFNRRFETILVQEPDEATCIRMLQAVLPGYEAHHGIGIAKDAVPDCVRLAKRYMKDKRLPDAALDLLDRTMASLKMTGEIAQLDLQSLKEQSGNIEGLAGEAEGEEAQTAVRNEELAWLNSSIQARMSPILLGALEDETDFAKLPTSEEQREYLDRTLEALEVLAQKDYVEVSKAEIAAVVAHKTGIPVGKIQSGEKERMLNMEDYLKRRLVGQDHTLKVISEAVIESRSGIRKAGQPIGSFFFLGPTGTGKTELAKALAEFLFNDEKAMIRFDMSEFKEEHSAALLYGAPPGYVGYEEGGLLVNQIRQKPYAVVLFDEIEKAHPSVFDIFLQIMDEGTIHDKLGKEGDFTNAIVIFTSNIASQWIAESFEAGGPPAANALMEKMAGHFRPEFLARLTEIIPFAPISEVMAVKIFDIQAKSLHDSLRGLGITLEIGDDVKRDLVMEGFDSRYGARQIASVIRNQLRRPLSRLLISGKVKKGDALALLPAEGGGVKWELNGGDLEASVPEVATEA